MPGPTSPIETPAHSVLGADRPRPDSRERVTGTIRYAADEPATGILHGRLVLGLYAHARIDGIDASEALAVPGVVAVLTADDLPIRGSADMRMFQPLARDEIVFAGQPVAIVVAETEAAAADGAARVIVDATPLAPVLDPEAAMAPDAPRARARSGEHDGTEIQSIHAGVGGHETGPEETEALSPNVVGKHHHVRGDAAAALDASAVTVHRRFVTPWVYQAYLEPHAATAWPTADGGLEVAAAAQGTQYARSQLAKIYGLPLSRVRLRGTPLGGAFGSKLLVADPLAAGAALALRRPVRVAFTRREDILATNPAPGAVLEVMAGARADGTLTGLRARLYFDAGAYGEWTIESIAAVLITGPWRWEAIDIRAYGVETNRVGTGSYRGPGGPQASFAIESTLDELAAALGMDPIALRRANLVDEGEPMADGTPWPVIGTGAILDVLAEHPLWAGRDALPEGEGVGVGVGVWAGACAPVAVTARLESDGSLVVTTGVVDMSGTTATFQALAAQALGIAPDMVTIAVVDAQAALVSPTSGGSVVTYSVGRAIVAAATAVRERLLAYAAEKMEISADDLEIVDGVVRPRGAPDRGQTVAELAASADGIGADGRALDGHGSTEKPGLAPGSTGHLVHVRVDRETGETEVLGYCIVQDAGKAITPPLVAGQMQGGAVQGLGWALWEEILFDEAGQVLSGSFMDYAVPRAGRLPAIETRIVEVPAPDGPYGARGVGEAPVCGGAAAVANAIAAASGARCTQLPMTPPRVLRAIDAG